jgi:hypothetical protein
MLPTDQACGGERSISLHIYASEPYMGTRAHAAVRAVCRAKIGCVLAFGTCLRDDPGAAFVRSGLLAVVVPGGAPSAKINLP